MRMTHIYKSYKYRSVLCRFSQKPRNDRIIKTVFLCFFFFFLFSIFAFNSWLEWNCAFPRCVLAQVKTQAFQNEQIDKKNGQNKTD